MNKLSLSVLLHFWRKCFHVFRKLLSNTTLKSQLVTTCQALNGNVLQSIEMNERQGCQVRAVSKTSAAISERGGQNTAWDLLYPQVS